MNSFKDVSSCEHKGKFHNIQSAYHDVLNSMRSKLPKFAQPLLATVVIFLAGISMNGDWMLIFTHFLRYLREERNVGTYVLGHFSDKFTGLPMSIFSSVCVNCGFYLILCGYLQWYFYIRQRETPEVWKCQPKKFLSWKDEKHEIILGTICSLQASVVSGVVSCYVSNGGHCTIYYNLSDHGLFYFCISIVTYFVYMEVALYYSHRMLHFPIFYKSIHKYHHRYKQPTPFSTLAMHPLELSLDQVIALLPTFIVPVHFVAVLSVILYNYHYNILSHSGVKMNSIWPWQCSTIFHDNHHQFFHVNFGVNTTIMDKLHGTYRQRDRIYNENTFYGRGKSLKDATPEELAQNEKNG